MKKKGVKNIYSNQGFWYIRYKEPGTLNWRGASTGLKDTFRNLTEAKRMRDELQASLINQETVSAKPSTIIAAFEHFKVKNSGRSASTKVSYDYFYSFLVQKFPGTTVCAVIDKNSAESFLLWLQEQDGLSQNTKFGIQKNFVKFINFLTEYEYLSKKVIINKDVRIQAKINLTTIFSQEDRQAILQGLVKKTDGFRIAVLLLYYTGLRPSDIRDITADNINLSEMNISFYSSKVDKRLIRPLHPALLEPLKQRIAQINDKKGQLLPYSDIKAMGKAFNRYLCEIGLSDKGYNLRTFRKDFISRMQNLGIPINVASTLVGHSNIKTTMMYYTALSSEYLRKELEKLT